MDIHLNIQHTVGEVSQFERKKFINLHASLTESDWDGEEDKLKYILEDLDVYLGRDNGSLGWNMNQSTEDPENPGFVDPSYMISQGKYVRETVYGINNASRHAYESRADILVGGQEKPFWPGQTTTPYTGNPGWKITSASTSGDFMGQFFNEFYRNDGEPSSKGHPRPRFMEIINEPLYELVDEGDHTPTEVFEYHNEVAAAIRTHNQNILIGGYTTAFPYFDENNFNRWDERMKLFYDIAGANMDFFSIHLYDFNKHHYNNGTAFHGPINFKGSRIEATFDMMEQYSQLKFGKVKPMLISEFGGRDHSIEWKEWTPIRDWQFIKAVSPMWLQFMDRPNLILKTIPFVVTKAEWGRTSVPYPWRLMRQAKEADGETGEQWVFTEMIKIYELWSQVNGSRVVSKSENPDILVDSYVDGNKAYFIASNLNYEPETIHMHLLGTDSNTLLKVEVKHLHLAGNSPVLDTNTLTPDKNMTFTLDTEATAIFEYTFDQELNTGESMKETKYYADVYKQEIVSSAPQVFHINSLTLTDHNQATLRVAFGRAHTLSKKPQILVNGTAVAVPTNYRGDDQHLRSQFFGMLEIPVPDDLLKANNTISIQFPDNGGYISSVTMRVYNSTIEITGPTDVGIKKINVNADIKIYPNPTNNYTDIVIPEELMTGSISVFNTNGVALYNEKITQKKHRLLVSKYPAGIYLITIQNEKYIGSQRLVLQ